jgi:peptide/nickel transport system substrate-binding protein
MKPDIQVSFPGLEEVQDSTGSDRSGRAGLGHRARAGKAGAMKLRRARIRITGVAALAAAALIAAGCSSGGASPGRGTGGKPVQGGTASYYMLTGAQPNWIFPFDGPAYFTVSDISDFQFLMYRPLYWFGGENTSPTVDYSLSAANPPIYSNGGKTVTITLKGWKWSNGETVDASDVLFWLHMMEAEYDNWAGFVPGGIPQNITSMTATGPDQVTLQLNKKYSSLWYTYNELSQISPMPMAWDVTSLGAKPGSGGCTTDTAADHWAKCKAVYNFLTAQAKNTATYASSPIWSVVDGPWRLKTFAVSGNDVFVPNPKYSGSPKPHLTAVKFITYTSDTSEYTALQTGSLNVGVIPPTNLPVKPVGQALPATSPVTGYTLQPAYTFTIDFYRLNFHNPSYGPVFRQLYIRQALEYLADQAGMAKTIYRGYGYPTTGPAPSLPVSQWVPPVQRGAGPYPFSIAKATSLLTSHGWAKVGGVMTCTAPAKCGPGIAKGMQLKITLDYATASTAFTQEAQVYKSDAARAGVILNTVGQTFNTIVGEALACPVGPSCSWQAAMAGGWEYAPDYEPTGGELFTAGAGANKGSYSSPTMNRLINETHASGSLATYHTYATYAAQQLPYIWMPDHYDVMAVSKNLHGVAFNPLDTLLPEYWYYTKS